MKLEINEMLAGRERTLLKDEHPDGDLAAMNAYEAAAEMLRKRMGEGVPSP